MVREIVDLPINSMVIFHSYVTVYQRVHRWLRNIVETSKKRIEMLPSIFVLKRYHILKP